MTGLEPIALGYFVRWAAQKAGKVGKHVDERLDAALAALADRIIDTVDGDAAVSQLQHEAGSGVENPRTVQRVQLALEDAVERNPLFATDLATLVAELQRLAPAAAPASHVVINARASEHARIIAAGGDIHTAILGDGSA